MALPITQLTDPAAMSIAETPIRLPIPPLPKGFRVAGAHAGLKRNAAREDVSLVVSDLPAANVGGRR